MRREDLERLGAWEAPLVLQQAIGEERAERVEKLLDPYDEPLEWRWPHERRIPRTARRRPWWSRRAGTRFLAGAVVLLGAVVLALEARAEGSLVAWSGAAAFAVAGVLLVALDARMLLRTARWLAITPTRLLHFDGRALQMYRWEGFAPHVQTFLRRGVGGLALTWKGRDGTLEERVELRGVLDPEPLAASLEARIRARREASGTSAAKP